MIITGKATREALTAIAGEFFDGEPKIKIGPWNTLMFLNELNGNEAALGNDWMLFFDNISNVESQTDGATMASYISQALDGKMIVINSMFGEGFETVEDLVDAILAANDEALRTEQHLAILKRA